MKKLFLIITLFVLSLLMVSCKKEEEKDTFDVEARKDAFIEEYRYYENSENVPEKWSTWFNYDEFKAQIDKRVFVKLTFEEVKAKIENKESFVIYYGFDPKLYQCPYCAISIPLVTDVALELGIDVYYLDIRTMRVNETPEYKYLYDFLNENLEDFPEVIRASTYANYKDGVPNGFFQGSLTDEEGKNIKELTDAQKEELKDIYRSYFCK